MDAKEFAEDLREWAGLLDRAEQEKRMLQAADVIERLIIALEPFAEGPEKNLDTAPCHSGLTTREKCGRCSRGIVAHSAIYGEN